MSRPLPLLLLLVSVCSSSLADAATAHALYATDSLYDRLGGEPVVMAISTQLIDQTIADEQLQPSFKATDIPRLKKLLAEQLCALSGGPCQYSGDTMKDVHAGLDIRQGEFYAMVELLRKVMINNGVALPERNELLALLAPMKRDVVTK